MSSSEESPHRRITQLFHEARYHEIIPLLNFPQSDNLPPELLIPRLLIAGQVYFKLSNLIKAKKFFLRCLGEATAANMSPPGIRDGDVVICSVFLGDIDFVCRYFSTACEYYRKAIKIYSFDVSVAAACFKLPTPSLSAIHGKLAMSLARLSKMTLAVQQYTAAVREARTVKSELSAHLALGNLYFSMRRNDKAIEEYKKSIKLGEALQNPLYLGKIFTNIGHAYLRLGNTEEAVCHLQKALRLITEFERDPITLYHTYNNLGSAYQTMNDLDKAEEYYELALEQDFEDIPSKARIHDKISNVHMIRKDYRQAIYHYTEILQLSSDPRTKNTARLNRGYSYIKWAILQSTVTQQAGEIKIHGHHCNVDDCLSKLSHSTKELYDNGSRDLRKALEYYEVEIRKSRDFNSPTSEFRLACSCLQDCCVILHELENALVIAEKYRARVLGEQMLKQANFNRKSHISSPVSFPHIRKIIKNLQDPVVYLTYTGRHIIGWVLISHSNQVLMNSFHVPLSNDLFGGQSFCDFLIHELTRTLMHPSNDLYLSIAHSSDASSQVQVLFDIIGKPLLQILDDFENKTESRINKLIVISDEYTSLIPFSCLYDPSTMSFLADRFCFQRVPSFLTLDIMLQRPADTVKLPSDSSQICVFGNPDVPSAKKEAELVANLLQTSPIFKLESMLSLKLKLLSASLSVIHIATNGCEENGSLVISSGKEGGVSDISLGPQSIKKLNISPALIVFSNCGEFVTTSIKASWIEAMCRAFIQAGAQVVLTSLWKVPTESALVFIQFFYQYLLDGLQSSLAVQKAILSVRCFPEFSQYIHWSGYQLTGRDISVSREDTLQIHKLRTRMGQGSVFPHRQAEVQKLKDQLISSNQMVLSNAQVLCGVEPSEVVVDFILAFHNNFKGGVFWISCQRAEFIKANIKMIEATIGRKITELNLSDTNQSLFVFDSLTDLTVCNAITGVLSNKNAHMIILRNSHIISSVIREIESKVGRNCNIIDIQPLSSKESTQSLVYSVMAKNSCIPTDDDREALKRFGEFTCGSPTITEITSKVIQSRLSVNEDKNEEVICDLAKELSLNTLKQSGREKSKTPISKCCGEWETDSNYDAWSSLLKLVSACELSQEHQLLLRCLVIFRSSPIPISLASKLAEIISSVDRENGIFGESLLSELQRFKLVKDYPLPVLVSPSFCHQEADVSERLLCVPQCLADCLWKTVDQLQDVDPDIDDRKVAELTVDKAFTTLSSTDGIIDGLILQKRELGCC